MGQHLSYSDGDVTSYSLIKTIFTALIRRGGSNMWIIQSYPKIRNAAARRPFKYSLSSCLFSNFGGPGSFGICTFALATDMPGSSVAPIAGVTSSICGAMIRCAVDGNTEVERFRRV